MNLRYLFPRLIRHFMPESLARFLLKRRWIIKPGLESNDPAAAVEQYVDVLAKNGLTLEGKRILVFGYGGRGFAWGGLVPRGAGAVGFCGPFGPVFAAREREEFPAAGSGACGFVRPFRAVGRGAESGIAPGVWTLSESG